MILSLEPRRALERISILKFTLIDIDFKVSDFKISAILHKLCYASSDMWVEGVRKVGKQWHYLFIQPTSNGVP